MGLFSNPLAATLRSFGLVVFLFSYITGDAQVQFFINPHVNFKSSTAFVDPASPNFNRETNFFENQYFYPPYAVANSARFIKHPTFNMGLGIGMRYKNDSRIIQLSWDSDVANFRAQSFFRPYNAPTHAGFGVSYLGINLHRFTLSYSHKISKNESALQTYFSFGAGCLVNDGYSNIFPSYWDMPLAPNGDRLLRTYMQPYREKKANALLKIGFENDLFINQRYLFSLNAYYIQGFGQIGHVEYVHEYLMNNEQVFSRTGILSRGSGFYFEVSRRINVYPWKKT